MQKSVEEVIKNIEELNLDSVYFIQGDELFFINKLIFTFENSILNEEEKSFGLKIKYGKEVNISQIIEESRTFSLSSSLQIIIIKEAQEISDLYKPQSNVAFEAYLKNPNRSTLLILIYKNELLDQRTAIAKKILEFATIVTCKKLADTKISVWIEKKFFERGLKLDSDSIFLIQKLIGNDLIELDKSIDKLINYAGSNRNISADIIRVVIEENRKFNVFDLQNAIAEKNFHKSLLIINKLLCDKKSGDLIPITALLFTYFSKLLIAYQYKESGEKEIANQLQVPIYFIDSYCKAVKLFSQSQLKKAVILLHELDLVLKGVNHNSMNQLELATNFIYNVFN